MFSVCLFAVCVSLGTATVSISKALMLLALLGQLWLDGGSRIRAWVMAAPKPVWFILAAFVWFALSALWTEAYPGEVSPVYFGHARLIWLLAVLYLLKTTSHAWKTLSWLVIGQLFVVLASWLMWLGVPLGWLSTSDYPASDGILFTSTLEQPIMSTLLAVLLWHGRQTWVARLGRYGRPLVYAALLLTVTNVLFIMIGRTGYLVMMVFLGLSALLSTPPRWRWSAVLASVLLVALAFVVSPKLQEGFQKIQRDLTLYQQGTIDTSPGLRLDFWRAAVEGIAERPWIGHGVGSYSRVYAEHGGFVKKTLRDPHQQYLFWWVEGGIVAVALLLGWMASLVKSALGLPRSTGHALLCTTAIIATMGLTTCPLFGAGMGEHLFVLLAALLATREPNSATPHAAEH
jgi:hypothetical protein